MYPEVTETTPGSFSKGGSMHQKQPPAKVARAMPGRAAAGDAAGAEAFSPSPRAATRPASATPAAPTIMNRRTRSLLPSATRRIAPGDCGIPVRPSVPPAVEVRAEGRRHADPVHDLRHEHLMIAEPRGGVGTGVIAVPAVLG